MRLEGDAYVPPRTNALLTVFCVVYVRSGRTQDLLCDFSSVQRRFDWSCSSGWLPYRRRTSKGSTIFLFVSHLP